MGAFSKNKIHLIGYSHLDPVWLWRWQEGYAEIKATFRSALDRMKEFPGYIFTCPSASYYEWVEKNAPDMFQEITARVKEGRWCIIGGMWNQPDCNIPSGESFARHFLYSQRYFIEKFGFQAKTGYNADSFGHNASMPKLLKAAGINSYVMMRPDMAENPNIPEHAFWWEAMDKSRVLTYRIANGYCSYIHGDGAFDREYEEDKAKSSIAIADKAKHSTMYFYGVGNHGGGPTIKSLKTLEKLRSGQDGERFLYSTPDKYFDEINNLPNLPEWFGDMQHHASLCYSAHSEIKRNNRRSENRLTSAEKYATLSGALTGYTMPANEVDKAWKNVLFNQFHDIVTGCSIPEAYDDAREVHGEALSIAARVQNAAIQRISWAVNTSVGGRHISDKEADWQFWGSKDLGTPIIVFNPLSWERDIPVRISRPVCRITDENGTNIPFQQTRSSRIDVTTGKLDAIFNATVPAMGWRLYWAYLGKTETCENINKPIIENEYLRLEIDSTTGHILSLYDKINGREVFAQNAAVPLIINIEHADTWGHALFEFRDEVGRFGDAKVELVESGPVREVISVESYYGASILRQDFILYAGSRQIQVDVKLDWREKHKLLKLSFPVNTSGEPRAVYDIPFGFVERPANGLEEPGQMWLYTGDGETGVALLNDGKYAFDVLGNDMRMTVANGSAYADHYGQNLRDGMEAFLDHGIQHFKYALLPQSGNWNSANIAKAAISLNTEETHVAETYHDGPLPDMYEGIRVSADNIVITAVKPAADGAGVIVRAYEAEGRKADVAINLLFMCRDILVRFKPYEVKTIKVPYKPGIEPMEVNLSEY